jgi:hypothetical protein
VGGVCGDDHGVGAVCVREERIYHALAQLPLVVVVPKQEPSSTRSKVPATKAALVEAARTARARMICILNKAVCFSV